MRETFKNLNLREVSIVKLDPIGSDIFGNPTEWAEFKHTRFDWTDGTNQFGVDLKAKTDASKKELKTLTDKALMALMRVIKKKTGAITKGKKLEVPKWLK